MHKEILIEEQVNLLPLLQKFSKDFFLVGGTAIALHIGHRRSIDFDLFSHTRFSNLNIKKKILRIANIEKIYVNKLVDLYFIIKNYFPLAKIVKKAKQIFGQEFNEKIFRTQLTYFKDIDYSETIIWMRNYEVPDKIIKKELTNFSLAKI